jgi:uncharacterized protein (DUF58 family)
VSEPREDESLLTRPALPLAAGGLAALLFGFRAGAPHAVALGATLLLLVLLAALYVRIAAAHVSAARELAPRACEDDRVDVRFRVGNEGGLALYGLELADDFPADRARAKRAVVYPALPAVSEVAARYRADCDVRRGVYPVGPLAILARDPLGLVLARREIGAISHLTVYPRVSPLAAPIDLAGGNRFDAGPERAGRAGAGLEFMGTRGYRPGDAPRFIHWPSSARAGELVVMEMEDLAAEDVAIFIDLERRALRGIGRASTLEYAIRIAAALAAEVARGANRVRLYARGARSYDVPAGAGPGHLARILEALALARADGEVPLARLLCETADELTRGASAVVVFSSLEVDLREYAEVIALFRARGVRLLAVLVDARTFLKVFDEQAAVERAAPEQRDVVWALLAEGATVYEVARGDDLAAKLAAPLGARE